MSDHDAFQIHQPFRCPEVRVTALPPPRVHPDVSDPVAQELRWLLQRDYEGDLGIKSSFEDQIRAIQLGGHRADSVRHDMSERMIEAATRLRRLEARWDRLAEEHRLVLRCVYGLTRRVLPDFGELGPLVLLRARAHNDYRTARGGRDLVSWLSSLRGRQHQLYERIRDDARACLEDARRAWQDTWSIARRRKS